MLKPPRAIHPAREIYDSVERSMEPPPRSSYCACAFHSIQFQTKLRSACVITLTADRNSRTAHMCVTLRILQPLSRPVQIPLHGSSSSPRVPAANHARRSCSHLLRLACWQQACLQWRRRRVAVGSGRDGRAHDNLQATACTLMLVGHWRFDHAHLSHARKVTSNPVLAQ